MKAARLVLDASVALSWCFEDESSPAADRILESLATEYAIVPAHWTLEISNILLLAARKKRIAETQLPQIIDLLSQLNIYVVSETSSRALHEIFLLGKEEHLTSYDAAYLELAMRHKLPLASKDAQLCKSARKLGVEVIGLIH
jgi:predicted nucleic acid-binding protein